MQGASVMCARHGYRLIQHILAVWTSDDEEQGFVKQTNANQADRTMLPHTIFWSLVSRLATAGVSDG